MKQDISIQLSIPQPCKQDWESMSGQNKGRFCSLCQHTVTDFTGKTDGEIAAALIAADGKICGRFLGSQLERPMRMPLPVVQSVWPKVAVAALLLMVASPHFILAQTPIVNPPYPTEQVQSRPTGAMRLPETSIVTLNVKVMDRKIDRAIPFGQVEIDGLDQIFKSDQTGIVQIMLPCDSLSDTITLTANAREYISNSIVVQKDSIPNGLVIELEIDLQLERVEMGGIIVAPSNPKNWRKFKLAHMEEVKRFHIKRPHKGKNDAFRWQYKHYHSKENE